MATTETTDRNQLEAQAQVLTARMTSVRYIGMQAMWMYHCCANVLKEYEGATNFDQAFAGKCRDMKAICWGKAQACEKYATELQEKLQVITDKLGGE